jgi:hypothetical protein
VRVRCEYSVTIEVQAPSHGILIGRVLEYVTRYREPHFYEIKEGPNLLKLSLSGRVLEDYCGCNSAGGRFAGVLIGSRRCEESDAGGTSVTDHFGLHQRVKIKHSTCRLTGINNEIHLAGLKLADHREPEVGRRPGSEGKKVGSRPAAGGAISLIMRLSRKSGCAAGLGVAPHDVPLRPTRPLLLRFRVTTPDQRTFAGETRARASAMLDE